MAKVKRHEYHTILSVTVIFTRYYLMIFVSYHELEGHNNYQSD